MVAETGSELFSLTGKVALVTGASRGLGQGMALALAAAGADLAVVARSADGLADTAEKAKAMGRRVVVIAADVGQFPEIQRLVDDTLAACGRIDILVNAAGTQVRKPIFEATEADWDRLMAVNLKAPYFVSQAVARVMAKQGGGKIINVGSLTCQIGLANVCMYGASKGGILSLTRGMAVEWAPYGIRVNAIGPGYYRTKMTEDLFRDEARSRWIHSRIPLGRVGLPEDLAGALIFLASPASDYVTGQILYVDGGWLAS